VGSVTPSGENASDAWAGIVAAIDAFLETISDPVYQRLCWVEGRRPWGRGLWACGERYEIAVIRRLLDRAAARAASSCTTSTCWEHAVRRRDAGVWEWPDPKSRSSSATGSGRDAHPSGRLACPSLSRRPEPVSQGPEPAS